MSHSYNVEAPYPRDMNISSSQTAGVWSQDGLRRRDAELRGPLRTAVLCTALIDQFLEVFLAPCRREQTELCGALRSSGKMEEWRGEATPIRDETTELWEVFLDLLLGSDAMATVIQLPKGAPLQVLE